MNANTKILLVFLLVGLVCINPVSAGLFTLNERVDPPFFGCSILGCTMQGDIDMNGFTIYNVTVVNASVVEFDPIFTAENSSIWQAINDKLNTSDQRYNDTGYIDLALTNYYTKNESDGRFYPLGSNPNNYINSSNNLSVNYSEYTNNANIQINYSQINNPPFIPTNFSELNNDIGLINETYANQTYYPLNSNPLNYINDTSSIVIDYSQVNNTPQYLSNFSNDLGLINETYANQTYYPLNSNPAGYLNETNFNSSNLTGPWVLKAGDTMTGNLNMSDNNITDVDYLFVHNISGRSPIYITSPVIALDNITATTFYGNINGQNGTIYGMTITNGTITNMHVSDSAIFNTSLIPELNYTWSLGNESNQWKDFYVGNLFATNISSPDITNLYNLIYAVNNSSISNFTNTNTNYNITLVITLNDGSTLTTTIPYAPPYNDTAIWQEVNNKLNTTDQRYNDTALINAVNTTQNIMDLGFYNTTYLDPYLTTGGTRIYWFTNQTNNVTKNMTLTLPTTPMVTLVYPITTSTISLGQFITPQMSEATVFTAGVRNVYVNIGLDDARTIELQTFVYRCLGYNSTTDTCNSTVLFANSTKAIVDTTPTAEYQMTYYVDSTYILNTSDRFILDIQATKTAGGNTNINFAIDDASFSRIEVPSPVGVTDISGKLDKTDQRYNDTAFILNQLMNYYNITEIDEMFANFTWNETDPIFVAENSTIWNAINSKLNITDQRYNDTALINATNYSIWQELNLKYNASNPAGYINWTTFGSVQLEPTGFDNPTGITTGTGATLNYNTTSHVLTITGTYSFWQKGVNYTKTGDSVTVPVTTTGIYYIYYDNGTLKASNTITGKQFITDYVAVAEVYYNNNTGQIIWEGNELHGHIMDSATHVYAHNFISTRYVSGLAPQNMTVDQNGNLAIHAQLSISGGVIQDEDLQHQIATYPFPANIQVFYQIGTAPNWSVKTPDAYPMIYSGDSTGYVGANGRIPYNRLSGGTWSLVQTSANNNYVLLHLFANNDIRSNRSLFIVQGQNEYTSLANARAGATTEINSIITTGLPMAEAKPIATFIVKTASTMGNVPKAAFQSIDGVSQFEDWRFSLQTGSSGNIGGTVTLVNTGTGLTGGPITSSGTISLDTNYVQGMINASLANFTYNETDPIFTAENLTIWNAINSKLNITDQRYNDTLLINATNASIWIELNNKLNITDQRYNDTQFILNELMNYYNKTEIDSMFGNFTWNETDPIFTAENFSIWNAINSKLNESDQRYNDTQFILNELMNYYNKTESDGRYLQNYTETDPIFTAENTTIWNAINNKLNTSDQRYNDTLLINSTNESIWIELNNKLNITDQRYNDTAFIINNYYNKTESDGRYLQNFTETDPIFSSENSTIWLAINDKYNASNPAGYINETFANQTYYLNTNPDNYINDTTSITINYSQVNNTPTNLSQFNNDVGYITNYTETDPIFTAENSTIWNSIDNKLNITDQRYNDTLLINATNESIWIELNLKLNITDQRYNDTSFIINNYYNKTESDGRYLQNYTETDPIFILENTTIWNAINDKYNASNPAGYINETFANQTYYLNTNPNNYINDTTSITINYSQINNTPTNLSQFNNDVGYITNYTETDPIFTAENTTIWNAINDKLNTTDQRYNDTLLINATNESIWNELNNKLNISDQRYNDTNMIINVNDSLNNETQYRIDNDSYLQNQIDNKLNITDQRYNDTALINQTNYTIWLELNNKLNISDQRYNDTSFIINNYYNKTESDGRYLQNYTETDPIFSSENTTIWLAINDKYNASNPAGYINETFANQTYYPLNTNPNNYINDTTTITINYSQVNNTPTNLSEFNNDVGYLINETDPIFTAENSTIWNEINNKLNTTDQRYNDTALINATNESIWIELNLKLNITDQRYNDTSFIINNYYNKTESDGRYLQNYTETDPIFTSENTTIWLAINDKYNASNPAGYINETYANQTYYPLNTNPNNYINDTTTITINYSQVNNTPTNLSQFNNDVGYLINETDPIFTAENTTIWNAINNKLNTTDQRYNDTLLINATNESIWIELNNKLNTTDQRYNDTQFVLNQLMNYYNITEIDSMFGNFTWNETDPIFTAENFTIWNAINSKLNESDQRYNDTQFVLNQLMNYYNKTESDGRYLQNYTETDPIFTAENTSLWNAINNKLNTTDQRYNDTLLINATNESIWIELNLKLNISDQRYNDTTFIINNYYNKTDSDSRYLQNYTETDPIFALENTSIWNAINNKLNTTDQRYNDTLLINATNESIWNELNIKLNITDQRYNDTALINQTNYTIWLELDNKLNITDQRYNDTSFIVNNYYNKTQSDGRYLQNYTETDPIFTLENTSIWNAINTKLNITDQRYNETQLILDVNATIKQPTGPYLANNTTEFWVNDTYLNITINNISKIRTIIINLTCTAVAGTCNVTSGNITHEITRIVVTPTTSTNNYRFQLTEYPTTTNIIDKDRTPHVGTWDIEKSYAINGQTQATITNANINEAFTISITYLTNGVTP